MKNLFFIFIGYFNFSSLRSEKSIAKSDEKNPVINDFYKLSREVAVTGENLEWDLSSAELWGKKLSDNPKHAELSQCPEFSAYADAVQLRERMANLNLFAQVSEPISQVAIQSDSGPAIKHGSYCASYGTSGLLFLPDNEKKKVTLLRIVERYWIKEKAHSSIRYEYQNTSTYFFENGVQNPILCFAEYLKSRPDCSTSMSFSVLRRLEK